MAKYWTFNLPIWSHWPLPASFHLFLSFSHYNFNNTNGKSIDGVLGIRTRNRSMVGADITTELWRPPTVVKLISLLTHRSWIGISVTRLWDFLKALCNKSSSKSSPNSWWLCGILLLLSKTAVVTLSGEIWYTFGLLLFHLVTVKMMVTYLHDEIRFGGSAVEGIPPVRKLWVWNQLRERPFNKSWMWSLLEKAVWSLITNQP